MKPITGVVISSKTVSLSGAALVLSEFLTTDNGAEQEMLAYLRRASASFNELVDFHRKLKSRSERRENSIDGRQKEKKWERKDEKSGGMVESRDCVDGEAERKMKGKRKIMEGTEVEFVEDEKVEEKRKKKKKKKGVEEGEKENVVEEEGREDVRYTEAEKQKKKKKKKRKIMEDGLVSRGANEEDGSVEHQHKKKKRKVKEEPRGFVGREFMDLGKSVPQRFREHWKNAKPA